MRRLFSLALLLPVCALSCFAGTIDLTQAVVVVRSGPLANAEKAAAAVLIDEMQRRSGIRLQESTSKFAVGATPSLHPATPRLKGIEYTSNSRKGPLRSYG